MPRRRGIGCLDRRRAASTSRGRFARALPSERADQGACAAAIRPAGNGVCGWGTSRQTSQGKNPALPSCSAGLPGFVLEPRRPVTLTPLTTHTPHHSNSPSVVPQSYLVFLQSYLSQSYLDFRPTSVEPRLQSYLSRTSTSVAPQLHLHCSRFSTSVVPRSYLDFRRTSTPVVLQSYFDFSRTSVVPRLESFLSRTST